MTIQYAGMGSKGPQYDPTIRVLAILGRRSADKGLLPYSSVQAQIETHFRSRLKATYEYKAPTRQTALRWEKSHPDYPEWALRNGLISRSNLLPWAAEQLRSDAAMSQSLGAIPWAESRLTTTTNASQGMPGSGYLPGHAVGKQTNAQGWEALLGLAAIGGAAWILSKLGSSPDPAIQGGRPDGRKSRRLTIRGR